MWAKHRDRVAGVARSGQDWMIPEGSEAPLSMANTWVSGVQSDKPDEDSTTGVMAGH